VRLQVTAWLMSNVSFINRQKMQGADNLISSVADQESDSQMTNPQGHSVSRNHGAGTQSAPTKASLRRNLHRFKLHVGSYGNASSFPGL